jgi:uncharacterized protein (UPF0276 family)
MGECQKPLIGLLYNPAVPDVVEYAPELVEYVEVIPERLWYDSGIARHGVERFHRVNGAVETLKRCATGRTVGGHGLGLSLPSATAIDEDLLHAVSAISHELEFAWFSEHLSFFTVANGFVPNAQTGLGLPVAYDEESLELISAKLRHVSRVVGRDLLLENPATFAQVPDMDMSEPEFFNRLYAETGSGMLLDLHNLHVSHRNRGPNPDDYLRALNPSCVKEIHIAGGDELHGFYTDSHSRCSPEEVWALADLCVGRFRSIRAIVFEFHESYFERLGLRAIAQELDRMHAFSEAIAHLGDAC